MMLVACDVAAQGLLVLEGALLYAFSIIFLVKADSVPFKSEISKHAEVVYKFLFMCA